MNKQEQVFILLFKAINQKNQRKFISIDESQVSFSKIDEFNHNIVKK